MSKFLPDDLLKEVFQFVPYDYQKQFCFLNKTGKQIYEDRIKKIKTLQRFIKKCDIDEDYLNNPKLSNDNNIFNINFSYDDFDTMTVYRYYIRKYPMIHLLNYPEFAAKKISNFFGNNRGNELNNWIDNNLSSIENRTRKNVFDFFKENNITVEEILTVGW